MVTSELSRFQQDFRLPLSSLIGSLLSYTMPITWLHEHHDTLQPLRHGKNTTYNPHSRSSGHRLHPIGHQRDRHPSSHILRRPIRPPFWPHPGRFNLRGSKGRTPLSGAAAECSKGEMRRHLDEGSAEETARRSQPARAVATGLELTSLLSGWLLDKGADAESRRLTGCGKMGKAM